MTNGELAETGPAFITRKEDGDVWSGGKDQLKLISNPHAISRLVVFDTWIRNRDRFSIIEAGGIERTRVNTRNVFLSTEDSEKGRFSIKAMDHTHCFANGNSLSKSLRHLDIIEDTHVFGLFPEFRPYIEETSVIAAIHSLQGVSAQIVEPMIAKVPYKWDLDQEARSALLDLIVRRAEFVANSIEGRLFPQQGFFDS